VPDYYGLLGFEWNYFEKETVELCVTPATEYEITQGRSIADLGSAAYNRLIKSELYKSRPPQATLILSPSDSDALWMDMRNVLFQTVADEYITNNQIADVNQIFMHAISSGSTVSNSAFITLDGNFHNYADEFNNRYGVSILTPNDAWSLYKGRYDLYEPDDEQCESLWKSQQELFARLRSDSS
jgi:hypothetical protein